LLSATDPEGRLIHLTRRTWDEHIEGGHYDVVPDWITETLEEPDFITKDIVKSSRRHLFLLYYKFGILPQSYGRMYFKVAINRRFPRRTFYVLSAYPAHHIKHDQEEIIWSQWSQSSSEEPT
jgi:hypothetical protein